MIPPSSRKSIPQEIRDDVGTRERRAVRFRPAVEGRVTKATIVPEYLPFDFGSTLRSGQRYKVTTVLPKEHRDT